ncbi:MAG: hypothetical protein KC468_19195, partial [Myxococcales bacterium]|nr:hypothetical protein [Myxococcales bacterium]
EDASSTQGEGSEGTVGTTEGPAGSSSSGATSSSSMTTMSSAMSSGSSDSGPGTTACDFVCDIDMPGPMIDCDIFAQDCPEGQKCAAYDSDMDGAWDSVQCVDAGDGQLEDPCTAEPGLTGVDSCDLGYMCWNLDEEGVGVCEALCTGTPENPMCPPGSQCVICQDCVFPICLGGCDPLLQDCIGDEVCIGDPNGEGFLCVLDASGDMAPEGTPCEFANVCNAGTMCVSPAFYPNPDCQGSLGCCAPFCDLDDPGSCEGLSVDGVECVPYYGDGEAPPGLENVGVCGVAP